MADFLWQPGARLGERLKRELESGRWNRALFVTAFASRGGVSRLVSSIRAFRKGGAALDVYVGVDRRGTSADALRILLAEANSVTLVHNPASGQIFHPKFYLFEANDHGLLILGSNNLTAGGLFQNFESAVAVSLDYPAQEDVAAGIHDLLDALPEAICKKLDLARIEELVSKHYAPDSDQGEPTEDGAGPPTPEGLAGFATQPVPPLPPVPPGLGLPRPSRRPARARPAAPAKAQPGAPGRPPLGPAGLVSKRWYKKMPSSDAQTVTGKTNPTGKLRLTQAGLGIDQTTYFRHDFFGSEKWASEGTAGLEAASIVFGASVRGKAVGRLTLRVDHSAHRESGQGNVTTVLSWGKVLGETLRTADYTGDYVVLERQADGTYRLEITPDKPGEAIV